jgi:TRAP-type C4-dicarboxylate transport system permease small subunit
MAEIAIAARRSVIYRRVAAMVEAQKSDWRVVLLAAARGIERAIEKGCTTVLLVAGLALLVILAGAVGVRYFHGVTVGYDAELVALIFPIFVAAGIAEAARRGAHVATQLLLNALNDRWRVWLGVFIHAVTALVYLYLAWYAFQNAVIAHDERSTILRVPGSVGYGSLTAGLALIGICSLAAIVRILVRHEKVKVDLAASEPGVV